MKIKDALAIAASQFIQQFTNKPKTLQSLEQYAIEELEFDPDLAKRFASETAEGQPNEWLNTKEEQESFFTWYYINHVDLIHKSQPETKNC